MLVEKVTHEDSHYCARIFRYGREFVHTSWSTEVTCCNKLRQTFDINKELFENPSR